MDWLTGPKGLDITGDQGGASNTRRQGDAGQTTLAQLLSALQPSTPGFMGGIFDHMKNAAGSSDAAPSSSPPLPSRDDLIKMLHTALVNANSAHTASPNGMPGTPSNAWETSLKNSLGSKGNLFAHMDPILLQGLIQRAYLGKKIMPGIPTPQISKDLDTRKIVDQIQALFGAQQAASQAAPSPSPMPSPSPSPSATPDRVYATPYEIPAGQQSNPDYSYPRHGSVR